MILGISLTHLLAAKCIDANVLITTLSSYYATAPVIRFFPLIVFHSNANAQKNPRHDTTIGRIKALVTAELYASRAIAKYCGGVASRTCVAPAAMICRGRFPGTCSCNFCNNVFEKRFCAIDIARAPPRELKNIVNALPTGMSFELRTTWTLMNGICMHAPAPIPGRSW